MTTFFQRETLTEGVFAELAPLLEAHFREVGKFQDIPLDVDRAMYYRAQENGAIRFYTVRGAGITFYLVGYALFFVRSNPHYQTSVQAVEDVIYLDPSVRGGTGAKFIRWCDEQLAGEGCQVVVRHVKAAHDYGKLLERQGYAIVDHLYAKRLDVMAAPEQVAPVRDYEIPWLPAPAGSKPGLPFAEWDK